MDRKAKQAVIRQFILERLKEHGAKEDRFGHIKYWKGGKHFRYKFMDKVVRFEVEVVHQETRYSPRSKSWTRLKSHSVVTMYDNIQKQQPKVH